MACDLSKRRYPSPLLIKPGKAKGENHPKATLTNEDVDLIRQLYPNLSYSVIAEKFECSMWTVRNIVQGITRRK